MQKILAVFIINLVCFNVFADDCLRNEKRFISLGDKKVAAQKYDKDEHFLFAEREQWKIVKKYPSDVIATGVAQCLDAESHDKFAQSSEGNFCWCRVDFLDGYDVDANWVKVEKYTKHKYKPHKNDDEVTIENEQNLAKKQNIQDCWDGCAKKCPSWLDSLALKIKRFGVCDKPLFNDSNIRCVIDGFFVTIKNVIVFDDVVELEFDKGWVSLKPNTSKSNEKLFVGEYNDADLYFKVVPDGKRVKYKTRVNAYSFQECDRL